MIDRLQMPAFLLSAITVVLFIIALIVFIKYGAGTVFYIVVVVALAAGFLNAWAISKMEANRAAYASQRPRPMRSARRRRRK